MSRPMQAAALAVARRPDLWWTTVRLAWRLAPPGWWRRRPLRPWPDPGYLQFRMEAMYGQGAPPTVPAGELVAYLEWCRQARSRSR